MADYIPLLLYAILLGYLVVKTTNYFVSLYRSRRFGVSSPLPFVTIYTQTGSWLFWTVSPYLAPFIERLPFGLGHWCLYVKKDFAWHSKGELHRQELDSDVFWIVGPGGPNLWVADADIITQVTQRWKDFRKPVETYQVLDIYGPSVLSTEGATWQRHRRITGPPFHERNSSLVFQESMVQGKGILASFTHDGAGSGSTPGHEPIVEDIGHWLMLAALNVISGAGFNLHIPWNTQSVELETVGHQLNPNVAKKNRRPSELSKTERIQQSVSLVSNRFPLLILFPSWLLRISPLQSMRDVQAASEGFLAYMRKMIEDYQSIPDTKGGEIAAPTLGRGDLLGSMVRAGKADKSMALAEKEIIGNLFVFVIAGHETTAITLQTGLLLLAINPSFQEEVQREIDVIWATKSAEDDLTYDDYPKMRVIMALMLETLRLYPPLVLLPKETQTSQTITYRGQSIYIPPKTTVSLDTISVQRNPKYWGPDPHEFRPSRWLVPLPYVAPPNSANESTAHADMFCPPKGAFLAFSSGFRACVGKKFAQDEFCTLVAVLLKDYSIELVQEDGMGWGETRDRAMKALDNRRTTIAMRMLGKVKVKFVKRCMESSFPPRG